MGSARAAFLLPEYPRKGIHTLEGTRRPGVPGTPVKEAVQHGGLA